MKHVKLFEQFINEAALPFDKLIKMIGNKPSCYDLAEFVYNNYDKVTGLRKSMRDEEMEFPSEIEDLVDHYGFDIIDFTDCYGMAAESLVNERKYSDEERKELEQKGMAMPGGRFPVKDSTDLKNAIWLLPKAKGNVDEVIEFLARRLKELGATNYENMFNKTLRTMGINKEVAQLEQFSLNEGKSFTAVLSYESPQSAEITMAKADKLFQNLVKWSTRGVKIVSSTLDKKNYTGTYTLDGDAKALSDSWDRMKKGIEKQDSLWVEDYGPLEFFDLTVE